MLKCKRIIYFILATLMLLSSSILPISANNIENGHTHDCFGCGVDNIDIFEIPQSTERNILCFLFGHSIEIKWWHNTSTNCKYMGDAYCEVVCLKDEKCTRCDYKTTTYYNRQRACIREGYWCTATSH